MITLGAIGAILLLIGLLFAPAVPIFAIAIVLVIGAFAVFVATSQQEASEVETPSARADHESDQPSWRRKRWYQ